MALPSNQIRATSSCVPYRAAVMSKIPQPKPRLNGNFSLGPFLPAAQQRASASIISWLRPSPAKISQTRVNELAGGDFIAQQRSAVLVGGTGIGKTHLAMAIARGGISARRNDCLWPRAPAFRRAWKTSDASFGMMRSNARRRSVSSDVSRSPRYSAQLRHLVQCSPTARHALQEAQGLGYCA
jgi:IstB-like ATP binding protein